MQRLRRLWPSLETLPGLSAVSQEWRELLGDEFEAGRDLLRLTDRLARAYPCPSPGGLGCPRRVVDLGDGKYVAVCDDEMQLCDSLRLTRQDLAVHEIDVRKLCVALAVTFGVEPAFEAIDGLHRTYRIGDYHPEAGKRFPIFLTVQMEQIYLRDVAARLCAATEVPFLLLVPTPALVDVVTTDLLTRRRARCVALADLLGLDEAGKLAANSAAETLLTEFHRVVVPQEGMRRPKVFPTPPDAVWEDIVLEFRAEEVIMASCMGVTRRVEPEDMEMKNARSGRPTLQWTALQAMGRAGGRLECRDAKSFTQVKSHKHLLSKKLRAFFRIEDDPIVWDDIAANWKARFTILPDRSLMA